MLKGWFERVSAFMFDGPATTNQSRRVAVAGTVLASLITVRCGVWSFHSISNLPRPLTEPVWFLWPVWPLPAWFFVAVQILGVMAGLVCMVRRDVRAFRVTWVAFVILAGARGGFGKILHNDVLLVIGSIPFLLGAWKPSNGWQVRSGQVVVSVCYFLTGIQKLRHSGPSWVYGDNMRWIMEYGSRRDGTLVPAIGRTVAAHQWLWVTSAAALIGMELLFPLVFVNRWWRRLMVGGAIGLHVTTLFALGLDYSNWWITVCAYFVDWPALGDRLWRGRSGELASARPEPLS